MGNSISKYSANARVYILMDDYEPSNLTTHPNKTLYKVNSIIQVNSKLSVEGGGNATVTFNDKDMKFWKYIKFKYANSKEWGNEQLTGESAGNLLENLRNQQEIADFRKHLVEYGTKSKAISALKVLAGETGSEELSGGILLPILTPQNLIWIHYLGRDGNWYAGFTGVITQMSLSETAGKTSVFTVNAKTPDVFFENSQLLIRTQNIGGADSRQNIKLEQIDNLAMTNVFSGKITSEVISETIKKVNNFFLKTDREGVDFKGEDPRYFKVRKLWGFGKDLPETKPEETKTSKKDGESSGTSSAKMPRTIQEIEKHLVKISEPDGDFISAFDFTDYEVRSRTDRGWYVQDQVTDADSFFDTDAQFQTWLDSKEPLPKVIKSTTGVAGSKSETTQITQEGERGYPNNHEKFRNKKWHYTDKIDIAKDFYNGKELIVKGSPVVSAEEDWREVVMDEFFYDDGDRVKPFQNLIATSLDLFTVDKMTAKDVLDTVRKTVLAYIYFEGDGNLRVERPYFDIHLGMLDNAELSQELPPDYDTRYLITKKDRSYRSHSYSENASGLVTRTELVIKPDWIQLSSDIDALEFSGKSESSWQTTFKFGEKQVQLNSIVSPKFALGDGEVKAKILRSYCYAMRMLMSSDYRNISLQLDQRPDLQLNRNMLFLDLGLYFVTKEISHSYSPANNRLDTTVTGTYARPVGTRLVNPYRFIIEPDGSLTAWETVDKWKEGAFNSDFYKTTDVNNPIEVMEGGETFESIEDTCRTEYSRIEKFTNEDDDFDKLYSGDGEQKNPYILCFRGLADSNTNYEDFCDDFYLMLPASKEFVKIGSESGYKQMSCGDSQSAGTLIKSVQEEFTTSDDGVSRPNFSSFVRLQEGLYRYARVGNEFVCSNFKYYDLNSSFIKSGTATANSKVICNLSNGQKSSVDYKSYLKNECKFAYNTSNSGANRMFLAESNGTGTWWEGVNIFPASSARTQFDSAMARINDRQKVDVFVLNYVVRREEQLKPNTVKPDGYNFNDNQRLFFYLKLIQGHFDLIKKTDKGYTWKDKTIPTDITTEKLYSGTDNLCGLYNIEKGVIGLPDKDVEEFINYKDITKSKAKQDTWFSTYYAFIIQTLKAQSSTLSGHSLWELFDLMSLCNIEQESRRVHKVTDAESSNPKNYPLWTATESILRGQRGFLIALFHLYIQHSNVSYSDMGQLLNGFIDFSDYFFKWKEFGSKYAEVDASRHDKVVTFASDFLYFSEIPILNDIRPINGSNATKLSYIDLRNLLAGKVAL